MADDARGSCTIGGVSLAISAGPSSPFIPAVPAARGVAPGSDSQPQLVALRWMMQKVKMKQDMLLLGAPGPLLRHTVFRFCELFRREVEYVGITRDTSEADLKQRCEIRNGGVEYVDQAPVRAALHGRVLVLEGIEKAERNVLPLLNNLLENREMALEDRRFLLAPERAEQLQSEGRGSAWAEKLVPVHPEFIVVALGLPGRGNPLDPPLRSRFASFSVSPTAPSDALEPLVRAAPSVPLPTVQKLCSAVGTLQQLVNGTGSAPSQKERLRLPVFPELGMRGAVRLLECFPNSDLLSALKRVYPTHLMPHLSESQRRVIEQVMDGQLSEGAVEYSLVSVRREEGCLPAAVLTFVGGAGPSKRAKAEVRAPAGSWPLAGSTDEDRSHDGGAGSGHAQGAEMASLTRSSVRELKAWLTDRGISLAGCFEKEDMLRKAQEHLAAAPPETKGVLLRPICGRTLTASQAAMVSAMLADHVAEVDICVVGEKGVGKSMLVRAFAGLLGYRSRAIFCYKDMTSRDLLQRRTTDPNGNTHWHDSPLVEAAVHGELAVLDGVHRLPPGTLYSTLGPLLTDREATLPDGSRLISPRRWSALLEVHGRATLLECGVRPIHPSFRCIACGEPPGRGSSSTEAWIDDEVAALFHFHFVAPLPSEEQLALVGHGCLSQEATKAIFGFGDQIRRAATEDVALAPLQLSLRLLLRIVAHMRRRPGDVEGALTRALSACLRFLPPASRELAERLLSAAVGKDVAALRAQAAAGRRHGAGEPLRQRHSEPLLGPAAAAAAPGAAAPSDASGGTITIGDVSCPVRAPLRPELVPNVAFVSIPRHVAVLRDMLLDWSLGHHLLLIGNQGVGKNKLVDRLLSLLRCEREYVQLHRDTTVQSLTLAPTLEGGKVVWEDSPLVRAVKAGCCLVVDEADKAPLEVVCVLKALVEDGELALLDGRTIVRSDDARLLAAAGAQASEAFVPMAAGFRMVVLANRPGFPFLGNDFYRVCGDVFSCHTVDNPDLESEVALLRSTGPDVPEHRILQLSLLFAELRELVDAGKLAYPYSTRELVRLVAHMQQFPDDDMEHVVADVFAFDIAEAKRRDNLHELLIRHGIATAHEGKRTLLASRRGGSSYVLRERWLGTDFAGSGQQHTSQV